MAASVVMLHNANDLLPLTPQRLAGKTVAVIGPFADCSVSSSDDGPGDAPDASSCTYLHSYNGGTSRTSTILDAAAEEMAANGATLTNATGSGITQALAPAELARAVNLASQADYTLLVLGTGQLLEEEGRDRSTFLLPPCQQALLAAVSAAATLARLIIAVVTAGGIDLGAPVTTLAGAYVVAGYGGEETGHGLWDVLSGRVSPSGRLPITHYTAAYLAVVAPVADFNLVSETTGVGRTYRFVNDSFVGFHFGSGLSYSSFEYSGLSVAMQHDGSLAGSVLVNNTGGVDAHEIVEVYVTVPTVPGLATPSFALKAFQRIWVQTLEPPMLVNFTISALALQTTQKDGSRNTTQGLYTVWVSGHLPGDPVGSQQSNVVSVQFSVPTNVAQ